MRRSIDPRIDRIAKKYKQYSLWIIAALMLLSLFVMQSHAEYILVRLAYGVYSLVVIGLWRMLEEVAAVLFVEL
ncbi:MAG: hypothetical protein LKE55_04840 [Prevotella sp.]|nr:hypothetical protein [Prevotella sp.]